MWGYWFCDDCNRRTGVWDQVYIRVYQSLIERLHNGGAPSNSQLVGVLPDLDIGAFARAMWAWSFALIRTLANDYPDIANAVRTGAAVEPPDDVQLLLGVTKSLRIWGAGQRDGLALSMNRSGRSVSSSGLVVPGIDVEELPITVVASPPFSVVLAHLDRPPGVPHVSINDWLLDPAGKKRDVAINLPLVKVLGEENPVPVRYANLVAATAKSGLDAAVSIRIF